MALLSISLQNCEVKIGVKLEVTSLSPFILFLAIKKLHVALTLVDIVLVRATSTSILSLASQKSPVSSTLVFLVLIEGPQQVLACEE